MSRSKVHVKKGDVVQILSGNDRGKRGEVLEVQPREGKVIVDRINIQKKATRRGRRPDQEGGIIERPGPIHASKVMVVCPSCQQATRVSRSRSEDGNAVRVCKKCGKTID